MRRFFLWLVMRKDQSSILGREYEKCFFMLQDVEYLGHTIPAKGMQPTTQKICAIVEAPRPINVSQLKSFLGLQNYYGKFLPTLSTHWVNHKRMLSKRPSQC